MRIVEILLVALALASTSCQVQFDSEPKTLSEGIAFSDTEDQERFKQALSASGIPYDVTVQRDKEFINWDVSNSKAVEMVKDSLFVPTGRNVSLDKQNQARFKTWLEQRKIPYRTMTENKREYIVWEQADSKRVHEWEGLQSAGDDILTSPGQ